VERTFFIVNPTSGLSKVARLKRRLLDIVATTPYTDAAVLTGPKDAADIARDAANQGYERVIVAGGDGTMNHVINGIGDSKVAVGLVPLGTGNVLAYDLGLHPNNITQALAVIEANKIKEVDLGKAGDRRFLLMAGLGFDSEVVSSVSTKLKGTMGRLAYAPALLKQFITSRPSQYRLIFEDGSDHTACAYTVVVSNCGSFVYNFRVAPTACFDDGILDVLVFECTPAMKFRFLIWLLSSLFTHRVMDFHATSFKVSRVHIDASPPVRMQLDGDVYGESGVDIEVLPKALRLIVP